MREIDFAPSSVVKSLGRRPQGRSGFGALVSHGMPRHLRKWNIALVEQPSLIEGKALTRQGIPHRVEHGSESNKKSEQEFVHWLRAT